MTKSVILDDTIVEQIKSNYSTFNAGAGYILGAWFPLRARSLNSLKGIFSSPELELIINCFSDHIVNPASECRNSLILNVSDFVNISLADKLYNVDAKKLLNKLENLTDFQAYFLVEFSCLYWETSNRDLGSYIWSLL